MFKRTLTYLVEIHDKCSMNILRTIANGESDVSILIQLLLGCGRYELKSVKLLENYETHKGVIDLLKREAKPEELNYGKSTTTSNGRTAEKEKV